MMAVLLSPSNPIQSNLCQSACCGSGVGGVAAAACCGSGVGGVAAAGTGLHARKSIQLNTYYFWQKFIYIYILYIH
jgi:hypothetical protein